MKHTIKRLSTLFICLSVISAALSACSRPFFNATTSYYHQFTAGAETNEYHMTGTAYLTDTLFLVTITPTKDSTARLHGSLSDVSENLQLIYVAPDKEELIIVDNQNQTSEKRVIDTTISLKKGAGYFEFRGDDTSFQLDLTFSDLSSENLLEQFSF